MRKKSKTAKLVRALRNQASAPKHRYLLVTTGAAFLAERVARIAITEGWRLVKGEDPPATRSVSRSPGPTPSPGRRRRAWR